MNQLQNFCLLYYSIKNSITEILLHLTMGVLSDQLFNAKIIHIRNLIIEEVSIEIPEQERQNINCTASERNLCCALHSFA